MRHRRFFHSFLIIYETYLLLANMPLTEVNPNFGYMVEQTKYQLF